MLTKVLYGILVLVIGMVVFMGATFTIQTSHLMNQMETFLVEEDFASLNRLFASFHNEKELASVQSESNGSMLVFQSARVFNPLDDEGNQMNIDEFARSLSFIVYGFDADFATITTIDNVRVNDSGFRFLDSEGNVFHYMFNVYNENNVQVRDNVSGTHQNIQVGSTNLIHANINLDLILDEINEISSIELLDRDANTVLEINDFNLENDNWSTLFDEKIADLIEKNDRFNQASGDEREQIVEEIDEWIAAFNEVETFHFIFSNNEVFGFGVTLRIFAVMGVYVLLAGVIAYFIFRKKKDQLDIRKAI